MNSFLVDSHCHLDRLDLSPFNNNLQAALAAAKSSNIAHFLNVCVHPDDFPSLLNMAIGEPTMSVSVGLHPTETILQEPTIDQLVAWANHPKVVAIGETGLDYYHPNYDKTTQLLRFRTHIRAAKKVNKPLIIHTRHAVEDTLTLLEEEGAKEVGGVLHCFTEDLEMAKTAIEKFQFYVSFSGILTFKNSSILRETARQLPLDRLLIETDAPYLTPVPFRGKPNQPAYVRYVAETLALLHNVSFEKVAYQTTDNFFKLFKQAKHPFNQA